MFKLLASEIQSYIYSGKLWTGLDAFCGTRFSLTELVLNWCLNLERNSLGTISSYFVKFCDVHGKTNEFVFRNGTTLLTVVNIGNIVKGLVLLIDCCSYV